MSVTRTEEAADQFVCTVEKANRVEFFKSKNVSDKALETLRFLNSLGA